MGLGYWRRQGSRTISNIDCHSVTRVIQKMSEYLFSFKYMENIKEIEQQIYKYTSATQLRQLLVLQKWQA